MVKNFIHILRTYLVTFRYTKKKEISLTSLLSLSIIYGFVFSILYFFFISLI